MKKRNLDTLILFSCAIIFSIFLFSLALAVQQSISVTTGYVDEAGVYNLTNITVADLNQTVNITQVNLTLLSSSTVSLSNIFIILNGTNTNATFSNTSTTFIYTNKSIGGLISNATGLNTSNPGYFWFNVTANQTGNISVNVTTLDVNGALNWTAINITINDTIKPLISFVNQTPADTSTGLTSIPVNVSASDSGSGLQNVKIYLSNSSGLVAGSPITNSNQTSTETFYYNFTGLTAGTYYLWAIASDNGINGGNSNPTSNLTLGVGSSPNNPNPSCVSNWNYTLGTCVNGTQLKSWYDLNSCVTPINRPADTNQSCTTSCTTNWDCTWGSCINGTQIGLCTDTGGCNSPENRTRNCVAGSSVSNNNTAQRTGIFALSSLSSAFYVVVGIIVISVIGVVVILIRLRKKSPSSDFGSASNQQRFAPRGPPAGPFSGPRY